MKLFPKLAILVITWLALSVFALCASFYVSEKRSIQNQAQEERRALLQNLVHITREALVSGDDLLLVKYTRWLQRWNPAVVSLSVVSPKGDILAHSEPARIGQHESPLLSETNTVSQKESILVQTQPVQMGRQWAGTVSAGFSETRLDESLRARLRGLKRRLSLIAFSALIAGIGISFAIAHSWTSPIAVLSRAATSLGQGQFKLELNETMRRSDEIGFLARSFNSMARDLEKLDTMKEDFVSAVTHELRSPLGAMESYLNLIQDEMREGVAASEWGIYVERLRVNTQRLNRFVSDLLDVAALERGRMELARRPVDLVALIRDVLQLFEARIIEKRFSCQTVIPSYPIRTVMADPEKIRQVLINLISNAVKFTPEKGTLRVGVEDNGEDALITTYVQDSGVGIAPEDQTRIFNKFEQVSSARAGVKGPKGTGLGLAISKNLIAAHEGTLTVHSEPGRGSRFTFTLPVFNCQPADSLPRSTLKETT